tara:strand:- start:321 stop:464 length:144 start_codon:yes stop_codon:yes gene_type:complete
MYFSIIQPMEKKTNPNPNTCGFINIGKLRIKPIPIKHNPINSKNFDI